MNLQQPNAEESFHKTAGIFGFDKIHVTTCRKISPEAAVNFQGVELLGGMLPPLQLPPEIVAF